MNRGILLVSIFAALAGPAVGVAKPPPAATVKLSVTLDLRGDYTNKVVDAATSCGATMAETATFDASLGAPLINLKLASGAQASVHAVPVPVADNQFTVIGKGWRANDCTPASEVSIHCAGPVEAEKPSNPAVIAFVHGGTVLFYLGAGTASYEESAGSGTCPDSDPFSAGGPTPYFGVGDVLDPYLTDSATTTLSALAKLKKGAALELVPKHDTLPSGYDIATCNGAADGETIKSCSGSLTGLVFKVSVRRVG